MAAGGAAAATNGVEYSLGTNALKYPKPGMEVRSAFKDGLIEDWDLLEQLLDFTFERQLRANAADHPLMFSECPVSCAAQEVCRCACVCVQHYLPSRSLLPCCSYRFNCFF